MRDEGGDGLGVEARVREPEATVHGVGQNLKGQLPHLLGLGLG